MKAASHLFFLISPTSNGWTAFTVHVNRTKFLKPTTERTESFRMRRKRKRSEDTWISAKIDIVSCFSLVFFVCVYVCLIFVKSQPVSFPVKQLSSELLRDGGEQASLKSQFIGRTRAHSCGLSLWSSFETSIQRTAIYCMSPPSCACASPHAFGTREREKCSNMRGITGSFYTESKSISLTHQRTESSLFSEVDLDEEEEKQDEEKEEIGHFPPE